MDAKQLRAALLTRRRFNRRLSLKIESHRRRRIESHVRSIRLRARGTRETMKSDRAASRRGYRSPSHRFHVACT